MTKTKSKKPKVVTPKVDAPKMSNEMEAEHQNLVKNGLSDVLGLSSSIMGFNPGVPFSAQLSQVDTLFVNNRWYLVSNMRQLLSELYVEHGLIQTVVDVPVDDGLRGGVEIRSNQLNEEELLELSNSVERDNDLIIMAQALKWTRLFGGGGILIITDQDASTEFNLDAITEDTPLEFRAVDLWELFYDKQNTESHEAIAEQEKVEHYNYYGKKVHKSRVMIMKGMTAPSFIRPRLRGWGFSVVESVVRSINQYLKSNDLAFEVLDEFKLDVFKLKNLANTLISPQGEQKVRQRVQLTNKQKNYQNAITLDAEDDYLQKQLSFSGLAEVMTGIRMQIASDLRMPITKVFGTSMSSGFKTDQNDMENYNSMVESQVRVKCKYDILKLLEIKCQKLFGMVPDDLAITFKPLRVLTSEEEENVKTLKFNRVLAAKQAGELSTLEFRDICNKGKLFDTQLDTSESALNLVEEENAEKTAQEQGNQDGEDGKKEEDKSPNNGSPADGKKNSLDYDKAAYEVDGGDDQYNPWHEREFKSIEERVIKNPGKVDEALWKKAKDASQSAFGKVKWQFVTWWYKKHGGTFN